MAVVKKGRMMAYWVYENTIHQFTRIHDAECGYCNSGQGIHGGGERPSGNWYGPFMELSEATQFAYGRRQPDTRSCHVCMGTVDARNTAQAMPSPDDHNQLEELACSLRLQWHRIGLVTMDGGKLLFPQVSTGPGLYRLRITRFDGTRCLYIGESDNLQRRFGHYRQPGPTQQTNLRINAFLVELLRKGGDVVLSVAEGAWIIKSDGEGGADFALKSVRRMFEQLAITMEHASDIESLNR